MDHKNLFILYDWKFVPLDHHLPTLRTCPIINIILTKLYEFDFFRFHMWDHAVFFFAWIISLSVLSPFFTHVAASDRISLSLKFKEL